MLTEQVAALAAVEPATVRSWLARAPDFRLGRIEGRSRRFSSADVATLLVASHILRHRHARPHAALPAAARISEMDVDVAFIDVAPDGTTHVARSADLLPVAIAINLDEVRRLANGG